MTMTETRPSEAAPPPEAPAATRSDGIFSTGDHKILGRLQLVLGLATLLAGALVLVVARAASSGLLDLNDLDARRLASAETSLLFAVGLPVAWGGLATIIVPLQIGATRLALPRLHAASLWMGAAGGAVMLAGYIAGPRARADLAAGTPLAAGRTTSEATELWALGHLVFAIAATLFCISLLTTILTRRAEGMTITRMPAFSAAMLVTSAVSILTWPVFAAGLVLLALDQHFNGQLFGGQGMGSLKIWQHLVYLPGRPEIFLIILPALGALTDIVRTHAARPAPKTDDGVARRQIPVLPAIVAGAALTLYGALTLLAWAEGADRVFSITQPVKTVPQLLLAAPIGILLLTWLTMLAQGKPKGHVSLLGVVLFLGSIAVPALVAAIAALVEVEGTAQSESFFRANLLHLAFAPSAVALAAAIWHWSPKISGRLAPAPLGGLAMLSLFGGVALAAIPGWAHGLGASPDVRKVIPLGGLLLAGGFALSLVGAFLGRQATGDPYGGVTLEWATDSPPPPHNFDELPEVRSATPLADLETGAAR